MKGKEAKMATKRGEKSRALRAYLTSKGHGKPAAAEEKRRKQDSVVSGVLPLSEEEEEWIN